MTLEKGQTYWIDQEGAPTKAGTLPDPVLLGVRDANGNTIAGTGNDNGGVGNNARTPFTPSEDGIHYIAASARWGTGSAGTYALPVTEFSDGYAANSGTSGTVAVGGGATGSIETSGDADRFRTTLSAGTWYAIELKGTGTNPAGENRLEIYDASMARLASDPTAGWGWDSSRLLFKAPADGTYYIAGSETRSDIDRNVHPDGDDFELSLAVAQPAGYAETAGFLIDGYRRADGRRAFDLDSDRTLDVDITGLAANGQKLARWAFDAWSYATGIRFWFVDDGADIVLDDELSWGHADTVVKDGKVVSGTINVPKVPRAPTVNDQYFYSYLHEIGHVLGLGHPGRYIGRNLFPNAIQFPNETMAVTVMSGYWASGAPTAPPSTRSSAAPGTSGYADDRRHPRGPRALRRAGRRQCR